MNKKEILKEIEKKTPLGLEIFKTELDYYLELIKEGGRK